MKPRTRAESAPPAAHQLLSTAHGTFRSRIPNARARIAGASPSILAQSKTNKQVRP